MSNKSIIQLKIDTALREDSFTVFEQLQIHPHYAICLFLKYVADNKKLPFTKPNPLVSEDNTDENILKVVKYRLNNPGKIIKVNINKL